MFHYKPSSGSLSLIDKNNYLEWWLKFLNKNHDLFFTGGKWKSNNADLNYKTLGRKKRANLVFTIEERRKNTLKGKVSLSQTAVR